MSMTSISRAVAVACLALVAVLVVSLSLIPRAVAAQPFKIVKMERPEEAKDPKSIPDDTMRMMQKSFAKCIYRLHEDSVHLLLANSDYGRIDHATLGYTSSDMHDRFSMERCMRMAMPSKFSGVRVTMPRPVLRRALAEEAYLAANDAPLEIGQESPEFLERKEVGMGPTLKAKTMSSFGDCVVYNASGKSDNLVRQRPASSRERDAISALVPAISACVPAGEKINLSAGDLRAAIADGLYERSRQSRSAIQLAEVAK